MNAHKSGSGSVVLIENDTVHGALLDEATRLLARTHEVRRGSAAEAAVTDQGRSTEILVTTVRGHVDAELMSVLDRLHTIVVPTTGVEAIEMDAATRSGIAVANGATSENVTSIAEATALLMLALLYRLPAVAWKWHDCEVRPPALMLSGKTVGLIGYGAVAQALIARLEPFQTTILVHSSRSGLQAPAVTFVSLEELLKSSDLVCVLGTLNAKTRHLLSRDEFASMKKTAFVVNTARGGILDELALYEALAAGRLAGAALDTFEHEPLPLTSPLRSLSNVVLTPHCLGHTRELSASILPALLANVESASRGELPSLCKNPQVIGRWRKHREVS
jgi:phosphoglycerate dehydrogenase-like enzyme